MNSRHKSFCLFFALLTPLIAAAQETAPKVVVADGTPVELRFIRPILGMSRSMLIFDDVNRQMQAHPGDKLSLIVAADVKVGDKVVIPKGSMAFATITGVGLPNPKVVETAIDMKLDYVKSVTGEKIDLRQVPKGKPKSFEIEVFTTKTGVQARPHDLKRDLFGAFSQTYLIKMIKQKEWVPAGTRFTAYVHGDALLDAMAVERAQSMLPTQNATALVNIYRVKGEKDQFVPVFCDESSVGEIGARQYVAVNVASGKHVCRAEKGKSAEFSVNPGDELYFYMQYRTLSGDWELKPVTVSEGEDAISVATLVTKGQGSGAEAPK